MNRSERIKMKRRCLEVIKSATDKKRIHENDGLSEAYIEAVSCLETAQYILGILPEDKSAQAASTTPVSAPTEEGEWQAYAKEKHIFIGPYHARGFYDTVREAFIGGRKYRSQPADKNDKK